MKGILTHLELKEFTNKEKGNKFNRLCFTVDVEKENKDIITLKGNMSEDYARKYFAHCNLKTKDAIGKTVDVVTARRKYVAENEERTYTYIKYLNFVDENGKPIIMPDNKKQVTDLDF